MVVALIPVHDDPLRQASIDLVILPQGFALHRADEIVQLLLRVAVDVCNAHKFGTILIDAINNGSNRFHMGSSHCVQLSTYGKLQETRDKFPMSW